MAYINVFQRYEMKFILTAAQHQSLLQKLSPWMKLDQYGKTTIQSLYYDTPNKLLIRRSIEKPAFKEKIRLRSYGLAKESSDVFLELKRKTNGLVYKRRIPLLESRANLFFQHEAGCGDGQIAREITYFRDCYEELVPSMMILYDRSAYYGTKTDLRITFDENIRYRENDLNLHSSLEGTRLLPEGKVLMEVKILGAQPLWFVKILEEEGIQKTSFSKYGAAYQKLYCPQAERKLPLWKTYSTQSSAPAMG